MVSKIYKYIFCFINALIGVFTLKFHYTMLDIFGDNSEVYLDSFKLTDILILIVFFLIWLLLFYILDRFLKKDYKNKTFKITNKKLLILSIITLLICWCPYYLSFFPGGVYSDTYVQFVQARFGITGGGYSVFYSLYIKFLYIISFSNSTVTFALMTIIQVAIFIAVISYFIVWLKNKKVSKNIIIISLLFFGLNPRIPIYALSLWKDSLFSIFLFLYSIYVFDIIYTDTKVLSSKFGILKYCLLCVLVSLFRNNGYYIIVIISVILFIKYYKKLKINGRFNMSLLLTLLSIIGVYNILFPLLGLKIPYRENIGVELQQIGYVIANEDVGNDVITEVSNYMPYEKMKKYYHPMIVDTIKTDDDFNDDYLEKNKDKFWKMYFELMLKYPADYIKALLFNNVGFWNYYTTCGYAGSDSLIDYYDDDLIQMPDEGDVSNNIDVINNIFGFSLKGIIRDIAAYINNCAIGTLIMFIGLYLLIYKNKTKYIIVYLSSIFIFVVLFLGTPVAFSARYIIYTILFIPFGLIIPFIKDYKK